MPCRLSAAIALALSGALWATAAHAHAGPEQAGPPSPPAATGERALPTTQLPRNIRPTHYRIEVTPHAGTLRFDARASIELEVLEPTAKIVLHALELEFEKV